MAVLTNIPARVRSGIPAVEDKIVQMALKKIFEAIFEQDFMDTSYGFRPNRSYHDTLTELDRIIMNTPVNFVVDMAMPSAMLAHSQSSLTQWSISD